MTDAGDVLTAQVRAASMCGGDLLMPLTCLTCGHANREAARFCSVCGASLSAACRACGADLVAGARFCDACGAPVSAEAAESRKVLTVVFADLVGSTALQERFDAESIRRVMSRFYDRMREVLESHEGQLEKLAGDAVVGAFGKPGVREDDALRGVRAAAAMVNALGELNGSLEQGWGVRLRVRVGVNTGELVVGEQGELVGDTMNTAARLEQAAQPGEVLIGEATWRLVHHAVELEPVEPLKLKGKAIPVNAWRLVSAWGTDRRQTPAVQTPLVGRAAELERLRTVFEQVCDRHECRLVTVIGFPGLGKSRLAREFGAALAESATVVYGHCEPTGEGITFLPVAEIVRVVAGIGEADPADVVREKLGMIVAADDPERDRVVEVTAGVLGVSEPASAQETFWALRRGLEMLAHDRPLILVLDDLHWAEPMLLDLVEHLIEWVRDAPVLLVALARPELREARAALLAGRRAADVIELEPLDQHESLALVTGLLGDLRVPEALRDRILETTEGNPLFLGETLRMLIDEGVLRREGDAWVTAGDSAAIEVPPTIQALLAARIERLRSEERAVVERASVIGKQFYRGAVAELVTPPVRAELDTHLEALRRKEMVEPESTYWIDEPVYRFHHVLIRDAAYRSLLKEARAELHERFADWLETKAGELVGEHEEVIAFHLEQAHEYRRELSPLDDRGHHLGARAAQRLHSAGRRALAREDLAAAANLLGRALARAADREDEVLWDLCEAVLSAGDTSTAAGLVERYSDTAAAAAAAAADSRLRARAAVLQGQLANLTGTGSLEATATSTVAAARELGDLGDPAGEAKAYQVAAQAYARLGQVAAVEDALDRALAAARAAGDRRRTTAVLAAAPRAALWGPSPVVRASGRCLDVVRILRMTPGNRHVEAVALRCQAVLEAMRGRGDAARDILASGRATLQELGLAFELNETAVHAGIVELLCGNPGAACEQLRTARAGFEALGVASGAAQAAALLARALVALGGEEADAEAVAQSAFAEQHSGEDLKTVITLTSARAQALARSGSVDDALAMARRAMALAEPTDALADKADAAIALSQVLMAAGLGEEAREVARTAVVWYEAKGHRVGAERATQLAGEAGASGGTAAAGYGAKVLGSRPPESWFAEYERRVAAHDIDALVDLYAEDWVLRDHRSIGWQQHDGRSGARLLNDSVFKASPDTRAEVSEVLACDDRVIAVRIRYYGQGKRAGAWEFRVGQVAVVENGRNMSLDQYDYDDTEAMLDRFAELSLKAPQRFRQEFKRRFDAHDVDGCVELTAEDWVQIDHRKVGWGRSTGRERARELLQSVYEDLAADLTIETDAVLACDDHVIAELGRWRGTTREGGGEFEVPFGAVVVIVDGRRVSEDIYEPESLRAMIARYVELGGGLGPLGDRPPERWLTRLASVTANRDAEQLPLLYVENFEFFDHRHLGWEPSSTRRAAVERVTSTWTGSTDSHLEVYEVLACDERAVAVQMTWEGGVEADVGAGRFAFPLCVVVVVDGDRAVRYEQFEPEDREAALTRFAELTGQASVLGNRAPERRHAEWIRRWDARDLDRLMDLYAEDWVLREHRALGTTEGFHGRAELQAQLESILSGAPDTRFEIDEVLACDEQVIAYRMAWRGTALDGGGRFESPVGFVCVIEDGNERSADLYDPEDGQGMIARYAELGGGYGPLGDRPPERYLKAWIRTHAARDADGLRALAAERFKLVDHRRIGWGELDIDAAQTAVTSGWESSKFLHEEVEEVLACSDSVIAVRLVGHGSMRDGGGVYEIPELVVVAVEDGRAVTWDQYAPDDRDAVLARFAELAGTHSAVLGDRPPERVFAEYKRRFDAHDLDGLLELMDEKRVLIDHRRLGWEDAYGLGETHAGLAAAFSVSPDVRFEIDEVLACDDDVVALRARYIGHAAAGSGEFENPVGVVSVISDGRVVRTERYEPDATQAMIARYAELGGGQGPLGDRPPERFWAEFCRRRATRDVDWMAELYGEDCVAVEHRKLGWDEMRGREAAREHLRSVVAAFEPFWLEVDEVLACNERVIALTATAHGFADHADGGGAGEVSFGYVTVIEDGVMARLERYEPNNRQTLLARFTELTTAAGRS